MPQLRADVVEVFPVRWRNGRIESLLGAGAVGAVYKASHADLARAVAINVLHPHCRSDPRLMANGIGVAMIAGAGLKIAAVGGTLLMLFMYLAELPLALGGTNPITDSHWVEAMLLIISAVTLSGDTWGLGKWWAGKVGNSWLR